jgi:hypothetical protein
VLDLVTYTHPNGTSASFNPREVEIRRALTPREEFRKRFAAARSDSGDLMRAGLFALKKGLLADFYRAVDKVLEIEPQHNAAVRVAELRKQLKTSLPDDPEVERKLRTIVGQPGMRTERSSHFILLTDTALEPREGSRKSRAHERLDLLEMFYETFLLLFNAQDVPLDPPQERMMVVLFHGQDDYDKYAAANNASAAGPAGFWDPRVNVSWFCDNGTSDRFTLLATLLGEVRKTAADTKTERDPRTIRQIRFLEFLRNLERENLDMSAVSRECFRQMAGNTGLLPRQTAIPIWLRDGLATWFEVPAGSAWAGIGAVTEERLEAYRALSGESPLRLNIDAIAAGDVFADLKAPGEKRQGVAQAWSLTQFLMETHHFPEFAAFCRALAQQPADAPLTPDAALQLFGQAFGTDRLSLQQGWRAYMRAVKTDREKLEGPRRE